MRAPAPLNIGVGKSLGADVPPARLLAGIKLFESLVEDLTGVDGRVIPCGNPFDLARQLDEKRVKLALFEGFEFAWVAAKYPQLKPLVLAVCYNPHLQAHVVVHKSFKGKDLQALQGKQLAIPKGTKGHCRLFLDRHCSPAPRGPKKFFSQITRPAEAETALDQVCDGVVAAALVDKVSVDCYASYKPGPFKRLRVLMKSEVFPACVIAYREGALSPDTLERLRQGLLNAKDNLRAREFLILFKITAFEPVSEDYGKTLSSIMKAYPAPSQH